MVDSQRGEAAVKQDRDGAGPSGHILDIGLKVDDERIIRRDRQGSQEEQVKHPCFSKRSPSVLPMTSEVVVGVLALQGAFREHVALFRKLGVKSIEVRTEEDLQRCDGLVFPGGESTAMGIISQSGDGKMLEALRAWAKTRPSWGVCAGLILLADTVEGQKQGGQTLIGGLHVAVTRNMFGSQIASFEADVTFGPPAAPLIGDTRPFHALFIRAPGINAVSDDVSVICELPDPSGAKIVGVRQVRNPGPTIYLLASVSPHRFEELMSQGHIMGTSFHPELTEDTRFHEAFVKLIAETQKCA